MYKIGYEQTDKNLEIEIYDIIFELPRITEKLQNDIRELSKKENDISTLNESIDLLLGAGAVNKINKKRINDGYRELDLINITEIISFIGSITAKEIIKSKNRMRQNVPNKKHK